MEKAPIITSAVDSSGRPAYGKSGWLSRIVMGRIYTENNVLILVTGPTGIGKTYCGLKLCETFDPQFSIDRVVFNMTEFLNLLPDLPSKSFILFDEPGISVGHRTWLSPANMAINIVAQSFRYKIINVIFALPSRFFLDKVPREMCHFEIMMNKRGSAAVYRIHKSSFVDNTYTKFLGHIYLNMPSKPLYEAYEVKRKDHQDALYERLRREQEALSLEHEERLEKALTPQRSFEEDVEKGMMILPELIDWSKVGYTTVGLIDVPRLRVVFARAGITIRHNRAYDIRKELITRLEANDGALLKKLRAEKGELPT